MATDQYAAPLIASGKLIPAINSADGSKLKVLTATYAKTAADNDTSILRLWKSVDPNLIPIYGGYAGAAIAGLTSVSLGVYRAGGAALAAACFMSAVNLAAGFASTNPKTAQDTLTAVALADQGQKRVFEFAGHNINTRQGEYDIAATLTTAGTNTGQMTWFLVVAQG